MGKIYKKKQTTYNECIGFVCDRCKKTIEKGGFRTDNFSIDYTCGYGTPYDMTQIEATICDECLVDIIKKEIPGAKITNHLE